MIKKNYFWFSCLGHLVLFSSAFLYFMHRIEFKNQKNNFLSAYVYSTKSISGHASFAEQKNQALSLQSHAPFPHPASLRSHASFAWLKQSNSLPTNNQPHEILLLKILHEAISDHQIYPESALQMNQSGT